jgi:hypothetical protein
LINEYSELCVLCASVVKNRLLLWLRPNRAVPFAFFAVKFSLLLPFVQFLDEPAFLQLGDETRVDELFRLAIADLRS